jgi:NTE family protein
MLEGVLAGAAIPAVLAPVVWEGRALIDGGVANNTPISHAVALGARTVYVLATGHACALEQPPASALGMALHALTLLAQSRLIADIESSRSRAAPGDAAAVPACDPADGLRSRRGAGRALDARAFLDRGGTERPPIRTPIHLQPHGVRNGRPASLKQHANVQARTGLIG